MSWLRKMVRVDIDKIAAKYLDCGQGLEQNNLPPTTKVVTAMVVNIRGFHDWLKDNNAADVHGVLTEYYQFVHQIALDHNGTLDKLMADQMLFLFGVPLKDDSQTSMAWHAARIILDEVKNKYSSSSLLKNGVTIGISAGESLVGTFGNSYRYTYTAIGSAIDDAFRLAKIGEPNTLCITLDAIKKIDKGISDTADYTEGCTDQGLKFLRIQSK